MEGFPSCSNFSPKQFVFAYSAASLFPRQKLKHYGFNHCSFNSMTASSSGCCCTVPAASMKILGGQHDSMETSPPEEWQSKFLGQEVGTRPNQRKSKPRSRLLRETNDEMSWCLNARKVALKSIDARGLTPKMESLVVGRKKRKAKKRKNIHDDMQLHRKREAEVLRETDETELDTVPDEYDDEAVELRRSVSTIAGGMFLEKAEKSMEIFVERLSQFSGPSDRSKEITLNKAIVEAPTAHEVLELTSDMIISVGKGLSPSPLSPLNIATALHRIAKNMEKVCMPTSQRLAFARCKEMSLLVGIAMTVLPRCSAQGISNISWALSKIGKELLYLSEMERVAEVAASNVKDFNSQHIANVAGAFASMQHSAPLLFYALAERASQITSTFQEQEIAQVLWAFASLYVSPTPFLESLDTVFKDPGQFECFASEDSNKNSLNNLPILRFTRDQIGKIGWSYAVLGQLDRNFFCNAWRTLGCYTNLRMSDQYREDVIFASQTHQVNLCMRVEFPHLRLSVGEGFEEKVALLGKSKRFNEKTSSSFQKEVLRLLVSTGLDWVKEYVVDNYTIDAVVLEKNVALEVDGPSHFSRNTGLPLGHTMLKRRFLTASGWKVVSLSQQEWDELQGGFQQLDYLREILKDHL